MVNFQKRSDEIRLKEAMERLTPHDHPCLIYENDSEKFAVTAQFIRTGLDRGERCIFVYSEDSAHIVLEALTAEGIDTVDAAAAEALRVISARDFYLADTNFDSGRIFQQIEKEISDALRAGFTGLRAVGEMTRDFQTAICPDHLIEYDARLNYLLPANNMLALCLYNRNQYAPDMLLKAIRSHPKLIYNGVICRNLSYLPPDEFFSPDRRHFELERLLQGALTNENMVNDLRERKALLKAVIENTTDAVYVKDPQGCYLMMNKAGATFFGRSIEDVLGKNDNELFSAETARKVNETDSQAKKSSDPLTFEEILATDDVTRTLLSTKGAYRDEAGKVIGLFGIARDITERKNIEKNLRESEELFHTLCDSAPIGIFKSDCEGNNLYSNPRWEEISGFSSAESRGQGWTWAVHPEDRQEILREREEARTGKPYSLEYRLLTPNGKTVWVRVLGSPLKDENGRVTGYVGTVEDITELQEAKKEMLKSQKLESVGVLAGGIAHDFNNILSAILGNVTLAQLQLNDTHKTRKRLTEIESAVLRAKQLTQQLLTFARGGEPVKTVIELDSLLKIAADSVVHDSPVSCELKVAENLWPVEADRGQINQVIHNIMLNAGQAMPQGGSIKLEADNVTMTEGKDFVMISVSDTGPGIPEQNLEKIFDPYFTTKPQNSGLGLSTCYSIVNRHGGYITVTSSQGEGSTFHIFLPASEQLRKSASESVPGFRSGHGRILVMDDEKQVRDIMKAMLEMLGFSVDCTKDGTETVEFYRKAMEADTPYEAVILDLTIPGGVGGKETIGLLREMDPEVTAIVSSGYSSDPVMANYRKYGFCSVLTKPYRIQDLSEVLQNCGDFSRVTAKNNKLLNSFASGKDQ